VIHLENATAEIYVPDGLAPEAALARTTDCAVVAHQDDIEVLAIKGILDCFDDPNRSMTGVVLTSGGGSPRAGAYTQTSDAEMRTLRKQEQRAAARLGRYGAMVFLDHSSDAVRAPRSTHVVDDLVALFRHACPSVVYTHNLADKHDTHVAVALRTVQALRRVDPAHRPARVLGCEVWRDLDWLPDENKVALDVSSHKELQSALIEVFDSQNAGGRRYDLAALGRRRAHATFSDPYAVEPWSGVVLAMDLTPLVADPARSIAGYVDEIVDRFRREVRDTLDSLE
jgi:LmbE family N-acetylglucosaminyl deacetylase